MATSYLNTKVFSRTEEKRAVTEVKTEVVDAVTLTLTLDEARFVRSVVENIRGGGRFRDLSNSIGQSLQAIGVGHFGNPYTPKVKMWVEDVKPLPTVLDENIPGPWVIREDLCGWVG